MEINHSIQSNGGMFYIGSENKPDAELTYVVAGEGRWIINHTGVGDSLRGTGAGKKMLEVLVAYVRREGIRVIPLCPFARAQFDKTPEWADVLEK